MASESTGGGAARTGAGACRAAGAAKGAGICSGSVACFSCAAGTGGSPCNSLIFFSNASRSLRSASASAAQGGSKARQYATPQATRKDRDICMGPFYGKLAGDATAFPVGTIFSQTPRQG